MAVKVEAPTVPDHGHQQRSNEAAAGWASIRAITSRYRAPSATIGIGQMASSFLPCLGLFVVMYASLALSWWITLALAVPTAAFIVRIFIIQHDCGHGSFFRSRRANDAVGMLCSLFTLTPYGMWRRQHAGHHAHWNDLDRRMSGSDIYSTCLTFDEYRALPRWRRMVHRAMLHPVVSLLLLPPVVFLVIYRVPFDAPLSWNRERWAVYGTNLALLVVYGGLCIGLGFRDVLLVQLPTSIIASIFGVWLFSLQHRFDGALWARHEAWTPVAASLNGSSYLRLPRILQWFTGNIGFHHVHHLDPRIPNYRLEECHRAHPAFSDATTLTISGGALTSSRYCLWDEEKQKLVKIIRS
ncbi:MAG: fatty acid desaturase [Rhodospirillales bacterium]|nr:fatty acid desaturase [Rhodospirillales bacterium]